MEEINRRSGIDGFVERHSRRDACIRFGDARGSRRNRPDIWPK